jgi:endonuclease/exonuclease/phosphatase family metal-dependent hydrolase
MMRRLVVLLALVVTLPACTTGPSARARAATGASSSSPVSVMTFNVRYGTADDGANAWPERRHLVFDVVRRHDPDIVGVQEALRFQLDELLAELPSYGSVGVGRADGADDGEHVPVLYRTSRFRVLDSGTFWLSDTPTVPGSSTWGNTIPRIATWARLDDRRTDVNWLVLNVHLDHRSQPSREQSTALLRRWISTTRRTGDVVVLTGDFNAGELNPAITTLTRDDELVDTFRVVHPDATEVGTFGAFTGRRDGAKIDYVLAEPSTRVLAAEIVRDNVEEQYPSDHYPVTAVLGRGE